MDDHEEASRFRLQHRNQTARALDVVGKMKTPTKASPPKRSRAVGGAGASAALAHLNGIAMHAQVTLRGGVGSKEQYEVPEDVFAFLSRGEQAKLKAQRR